MKSKRFIYSFILLIFLGGLILLLGRYLFWEKSISLIERLFSPDHLLEENGKSVVKSLMNTLAFFHIFLGLLGAGIITSRWSFSHPLLKQQPGKPTGINLLAISTITAIYIFGLFVITKEVTGIRLSIYQEDSIFEYLTFASYLAAAGFFLTTITRVWKLSIPKQRGITIAIFIIVALICVFIAGEEISWGQRIIGWNTPDLIAARNFQQETNLHNFLSPRLKEQLVMITAIGFNIGLFGVWLGFWKEYEEYLSLIFPHPAMFVLVIFIGVSGGFKEELFEELLAAFGLIYSIWIWSSWRLRSHTIISSPNLQTTGKESI